LGTLYKLLVYTARLKPSYSTKLGVCVLNLMLRSADLVNNTLQYVWVLSEINLGSMNNNWSNWLYRSHVCNISSQISLEAF